MTDNDVMDLTGMDLTVTSTDVQAPKLQKMTDTFAEHAKLVFMFDVSGSMNSAPDHSYGENRTSKIDMVRRLAKQEIERRFKKYPDSRIAVIQFGSRAETIFDDGSPDELWPVLEKLNASGHLSSSTDILAAIRKAMTVCRDKPSRVGVHHFIMVGDGQDSNVCGIRTWLAALKASGVVLDYIHIGTEDSVNDDLKAACLALNGACVTVENEKGLEEKFITAVERLCLPAPE